MEDLRITGKERAIGMIGREQNPPEVVGKEENLKTDGPLQCVDEALLLVLVRHEARAVALALIDDPFLRIGGTAPVELTQNIARNGDGLAEQHLPHIDGRILVLVDRFHEARRTRREAFVAFLAVTVELDMSHMDGTALRRFQRRHGRIHIPGNAEIIDMHVGRMRHAKIGHDLLHGFDNAARRDAIFGNLLVEVERARVELERLRAARIDDLESDRLGMRQGPGDVVFQFVALRIALAQEVQRVVVVAEHHETGHVDDRDRGEFSLRLNGMGRDHRRLDDGGVSHLGVAEPRGV